MALDLKIQIFAHHFFSEGRLESDMEKIKIKNKTLQIYGDECTKDECYTEALDPMFQKAIDCRWPFFRKIYFDETDFSEALHFESIFDCYGFATFFFDSEYLFGDLNVFEKMFATCCLGLYLFSGIHQQGKIDMLNHANIIWAMYFDKFAEKFYEEGGWNQLKKVAETHDPLFSFMCLHPIEQIKVSLWKEALDNYRQFKTIVNHENCRKKSKVKIHVSLLWSKYQTEHFKEHVTISSRYSDDAKNSDIEKLLQDLKLVINFNPECDIDRYNNLENKLEKFHSTGMPYTETSDNSEEIEADDNLQVQNLTMYEQFCDKTPNAKSNFKTQQSEILTSGKKVGYEIMDKTEAFETVSCLKLEMGMPEKKKEVILVENSNIVFDKKEVRIKSTRLKAEVENSTNIADLFLNHYNTSITFNEGDKNLGVSSRNVERQNEPMNPEDVLSTNQKVKSEWSEHIATQKVPDRRIFFYGNEVSTKYQEKSAYLSTSESNFCSKNEETHNKNSELICASTANETLATLSEKNEILEKNRHSTEDCLVNKIAKICDGKINNHMELDKLREEQKDPEMVDFLKMILMLGDRQGIQNVLETLRSNEEDKKNSPKKSNKKKRSKNKSVK